MSKLVHNVRAYTFWFLQFYIAYTTLNKLLAIFKNNICGFTKKIVKTSQMAVEILRFSAFFKMAPAAILDFVLVQKWHKAIFFFQDGGRPLSCFLIQVINGVTARYGLSMSDTTPNLVTTAQMAAELLRFSFSQNGGRPPSWILF